MITRLLGMALLLTACPAWAGEVVADLSDHVIDVSVGFNGTKLLVFGAMKTPADVAVVIEGPPVQAKLWTKKREAGIWVNGNPVTFRSVPGVYAVALTRPVAEMAKPKTARMYGLSLADMVFPAEPGKGQAPSDNQALKQAQQAEAHYQEKPEGVQTMEGSLFRVGFDLPASVPMGTYKAQIHLLKGGEVIATQTVPFAVKQIGLEASIYHLAHHRPFVYAFLALAASLGLGGAAAYLFRRMS
ncbi:MAG: TIGR02186 family protein [Alphaproteobacteria bacterium]|nr:TIGR02186 family protein [Alphaproteobacteria bacterium]